MSLARHPPVHGPLCIAWHQHGVAGPQHPRMGLSPAVVLTRCFEAEAVKGPESEECPSCILASNPPMPKVMPLLHCATFWHQLPLPPPLILVVSGRLLSLPTPSDRGPPSPVSSAAAGTPTPAAFSAAVGPCFPAVLPTDATCRASMISTLGDSLSRTLVRRRPPPRRADCAQTASPGSIPPPAALPPANGSFSCRRPTSPPTAVVAAPLPSTCVERRCRLLRPLPFLLLLPPPPRSVAYLACQPIKHPLPQPSPNSRGFQTL